MGVHATAPATDQNDVLSDILQDLRLARASYCRSEFTAPFGIEVPFEDGVRFHFVVEGSCWLLSDEHDPVLLEKGDVALLPRGSSHVLADSRTRRPVPLADAQPELVGNAVYRLKAGGGGARALMVCCTIAFDGPTAHPLIELLPGILLVRRHDHVDGALAALLELMAAEVVGPRIGSATIMTRLADIVMTRIVRDWIEASPRDLSGWLAAVRDPNIGIALGRIHRAPGEPWTVESLANASGLSRSLFAQRFASTLGVTPARYLLQWRMRLALVWIEKQRMSVSEAAGRLGYASDAAFSRAFQRFHGAAPSAMKAPRSHDAR